MSISKKIISGSLLFLLFSFSLVAGYKGAETYYQDTPKTPEKPTRTTPRVSQIATSSTPTTMPIGDLPGWKQIFAEDFTIDAPMGTLGSESDAGKVVYTGSTGTKWVTYPKTYLDTYQKRPYRSDKVLSVHDGVLDFYLHSVDGQPAGANPAPLVDGKSLYQTYGRYSARFKLESDSPMNEYYIAWLLWPENDEDWQCAESDFPEMSLDEVTVKAVAHYGCQGEKDMSNHDINLREWHTFTQEWLPGKRNYYLDDKLVATSAKEVFSKPQRWQLQTETNGHGNSKGHLLVDWAVVYKYSP